MVALNFLTSHIKNRTKNKRKNEIFCSRLFNFFLFTLSVLVVIRCNFFYTEKYYRPKKELKRELSGRMAWNLINKEPLSGGDIPVLNKKIRQEISKPRPSEFIVDALENSVVML